jgi:hypothetical protein
MFRADVFSSSMKFPPKAARRLAQFFALALLAAPVPGVNRLCGSGSDGGERLHWKPLDQAQVKLDDKTPLAWNVYQLDKKDKKSAKKASNLVLLLLGHRYLMLDLEARMAYEVPLTSLQARGADFESEDPPSDQRLIPSTDWTERDVGPAELIRLTLGDYGRALEVSLPHPPDLRPFY